MRIVANVEPLVNRKAVLGGKLLDQFAHFSVANNCEFRSSSYSKDAGSGVRKNSRWSDSTARCRSGAATTILKFNCEAPCDTIRGRMPSKAPKARAETWSQCRMFSPTRQTI